jgi:plasmid stability protein
VTDFLIRNLDPYVLEQLRARAEREGRSLQAEIHRALKQSVRLGKAESLALIEELQERLPRSPSDSTADIRESRDSR